MENAVAPFSYTEGAPVLVIRRRGPPASCAALPNLATCRCPTGASCKQSQSGSVSRQQTHHLPFMCRVQQPLLPVPVLLSGLVLLRARTAAVPLLLLRHLFCPPEWLRPWTASVRRTSGTTVTETPLWMPHQLRLPFPSTPSWWPKRPRASLNCKRPAAASGHPRARHRPWFVSVTFAPAVGIVASCTLWVLAPHRFSTSLPPRKHRSKVQLASVLLRCGPKITS